MSPVVGHTPRKDAPGPRKDAAPRAQEGRGPDPGRTRAPDPRKDASRPQEGRVPGPCVGATPGSL